MNETPDSAVLGHSVEVTFEDGHSETLTLRPFSVAQYPAARAVVEDEARLMELALKKPKGWAESLTPEGYDKIAVRLMEVNQYFFDSCTRATLARMRLSAEGLLSAARGAGKV